MDDYFSKDKDGWLSYKAGQDLFRDLVENMRNGVFIADLQGQVLFVNQAFVDIKRYASKNEAVGRNLYSELFRHIKEEDDFRSRMEKVGFARDFEIHAKTTAETVLVLSVTCHVQFNDQGKKTGIAGVIQDITDRKRLETSLQMECSKFEEVLNFDEEINEIYGIDQLNQFIVDRVSRILNVSKCSLMIMEAGGNSLKIAAAKGLSPAVISNTKVKVGESIAGAVAKSDQPLLVGNIEYHDIYRRKNRPSYKTRSFMSAAMKQQNRLIGVLNVADKLDKAEEKFNSLDLRIFNTIVRRSAAAVAHVTVLNELAHLSATDPMTGLLNYRSFMINLDREITRWHRFKSPLSLLMADLDHFKAFNDNQGHVAGDQLLRKVAGIFTETLRATDIICRYGGDEFVIILPGTNLDQALQVGDKLCRKIQDEKIVHGVGISVGVCEYFDHLTRSDFIKMADQGLYKAKQSGKNQTAVFSDKIPHQK